MTAADARAWLVIAVLIVLAAVVSDAYATTHTPTAGGLLAGLALLTLAALLAWARRRHLLDQNGTRP